jgi:hypothetical protein
MIASLAMRQLCALDQHFGRGIVGFAVQREINSSDISNEKDQVRVPPIRFPSQRRREPRSSRGALRRPSESMVAGSVLHVTATQTRHTFMSS